MIEIKRLPKNDVNFKSLTEFLMGLTRNHPKLGRDGAVCPYVAGGIKSDAFYACSIFSNDEFDVRRAIAGSLQPFRHLDGQVTKKALFILFPSLNTEDTAFLDRAHKDFRIHFVRRKLMLGVFHPEEVSEGLHNGSFHPSVCDIPMAVVRNMVAGDKAFFGGSPHR